MRAGGPRWLLILLAILLNGLPLLGLLNRSQAARPNFVVPAKTASPASAPEFSEENINPISSNAMVHVASICELPDGALAASWYGGSREGAPDVAIFFATREPRSTSWSEPRAILTPEIAARALHRAVRKVGNSLLFADAAGKLSLLYVTITVGGWSDSSLNFTTSSDRGHTWTPSERLTLSPFFNISELVKNGPTPLSNGGWAVPIYHELIGKLPELLWLNEAGGTVRATKTRALGGRSGFQPSMVALSTNEALLFLRDLTANRRIGALRTEDTGEHWAALEMSDLPNPDSGLDALRLPDGRLLLAFNDSKHGRANLRLGLSTDNGKSWQRIATLADEPKAEFSYPFLLQTRDGTIHVVYTWKRKAVKHVTFNETWIDAQIAKGGATQ
jgi:predicted neuraminidase